MACKPPAAAVDPGRGRPYPGSRMRLIVVHYHLRPGGIRRVIELAAPSVVARSPQPLEAVVLATGEPAEAAAYEE